MGTSIFSWIETYSSETRQWKAILNCFPPDSYEKGIGEPGPFSVPFRVGHYGLFGFLAGVRNYACCEPIARPRGLPEDCDQTGGCLANGIDDVVGLDSCSWLLVSELLSFDYEKQFWNRRVTKGRDHAALAQEGEGVHQTYRELLGSSYFEILDVLRTLGEPQHVRVVFGFGS